MAPRTRASRASATAAATATAAVPTVAPLAVAPRRRVKITQLDTEVSTAAKKQEPVSTLEPKPSTRSSRNKKPKVELAQNIESKPTRSKSVGAFKSGTSTTAKPRGRPKKTQEVVEVDVADPQADEPEQSLEALAAKPRRTTRATRATASTKSSEAREKSAPRAIPRKHVTRNVPPEMDAVADIPQDEPVMAKRAGPKKKVTFQDLVQDKENQPAVGTAKSAKTSTKGLGLKAKPVRKATTTRSSKRASEQLSDNEAEAPKRKIQRVLTPKKITQMPSQQPSDESSDTAADLVDSPARPLDISPIRCPPSAGIQQDVTKSFTPSTAQRSNVLLFGLPVQRDNGATELHNLQSPARRPIVPSGRLLSASKPSAGQDLLRSALATNIASPARRPMDSPAKLLFPSANQHERGLANAIEKGHLFQSTKRSNLVGAARIFPQSATKVSKQGLAKSTFFSSPAKRSAIISPKKVLAPLPDTEDESFAQDHDSDGMEAEMLNEMEITQLLEEPVSISATSHQRPMSSPLRPCRATEEPMELDFDQSVLPIGSPFKISQSPLKSTSIPDSIVRLDLNTTKASIAGLAEHAEEQHVPEINPKEHDVSVTADELVSITTGQQDDQDNLNSDSAESVTPTKCPPTTLDLVLPQESPTSIMHTFVQSPEFSNATDGTTRKEGDVLMTDLDNETIPEPATSPVLIAENELTVIGNGFSLIDSQSRDQEPSSPVSLYENELTIAGSAFTPRALSDTTVPVREQQSPASLDENELTTIGSNFTPRMSRDTPTKLSASESPIELEENELTNIGLSSTPGSRPPIQSKSPLAGVDTPTPAQSPDVVEDISSAASREPHVAVQSAHETSAQKINAASTTPLAPVMRKFNLHTVVSKVPLKPAAAHSPIQFDLRKRKRHHSLGGQSSNAEVNLAPLALHPTQQEGTKDISEHQSRSVTTPKAQPAPKARANTAVAANKSRKFVLTPSSKQPLSNVTTSYILSGVVAYVDVHTTEGADASAIYHDLLIHLGARCVREWKDTITHVVFKDGNRKVLERARLSDKDIKIVGLSWPLDCDERQAWVDETKYLLDLSPSLDRILHSSSVRNRRKSMEPSTLVANGSGSVKRTRSRHRVSAAASLGRFQRDISTSPEVTEEPATAEPATPLQDVTHKYATLEQNSMTAAWKSVNASCNLGDDTPARKTMELLQKSYEMENGWDDTLDMTENEDQENMPTPATRIQHIDHDDTEILETGLTPAPYRVAAQMGSAPAKVINTAMMSYRERVEEMERRETRDNALGTNKGARGKGKKRMTMFGSGLAFEPVRGSPLRD